MAAARLTTLETRFRPHETVPNAFWLHLEGTDAWPERSRRVAITFDPTTFDEHPNSLQLLTFGNPWLTTLLNQVPSVVSGGIGPLLRVSVETPLPRVAYYSLGSDGHLLQEFSPPGAAPKSVR